MSLYSLQLCLILSVSNGKILNVKYLIGIEYLIYTWWLNSRKTSIFKLKINIRCTKCKKHIILTPKTQNSNFLFSSVLIVKDNQTADFGWDWFFTRIFVVHFHTLWGNQHGLLSLTGICPSIANSRTKPQQLQGLHV